MTSEAKKISVKIYQQEKCDRITADIPKGKRDEYKAKAANLGLSLSMLIQRGVESYGNLSEQNSPDKLTTEQKIFVDEFSKLPADIQKHFLKVFKAINVHLPK